MSPMETLRRTAARSCPLVLPPRQRRETERGPTLSAHVCFISMFTLHINSEKLFSHFSVSDLSADCFPFSFVLFLHASVSCLSVCVSNGRAVHYNGSSLLQWKSVRLDVALLPGEMGDKTCFSSHTIYHLFCLI